MRFVISSSFYNSGADVMDDSFRSLNDNLRSLLYRDGDTSREKGVKGALAVFFYPLVDDFVSNKTSTDSQMYISLVRIMLQCTEKLGKLVEQPENYAGYKVVEILSECQREMTQAPELEIITSAYGSYGSNKLMKKPNGIPQDYYKKAGVPQAYEDFRQEIKRLQKDYEVAIGLQTL